jgi:hypothetical protein
MTAPDNVIRLPKAAARRKGAGGAVAGSEQVEVYKILAKAGHPLTVPEIARQVHPGYRSAAMNAYREHKEQTDPPWLEGKSDRWSDPAMAQAMQWWVRQIIKGGLQGARGIFTCISKTTVARGTGDAAIIREGTYVPGRPPRIKRKTWVERTEIVFWTPELNAALNKGPVAGMTFLSKLAEYRTRERHTAAETRELLELAERAISVKYLGSDSTS